MNRRPATIKDGTTSRTLFLPQLINRTITTAWFGKDRHDNDLFTIELDNGMTVQAHEKTETGYFEVNIFEAEK